MKKHETMTRAQHLECAALSRESALKYDSDGDTKLAAMCRKGALDHERLAKLAKLGALVN